MKLNKQTKEKLIKMVKDEDIVAFIMSVEYEGIGKGFLAGVVFSAIMVLIGGLVF